MFTFLGKAVKTRIMKFDQFLDDYQRILRDTLKGEFPAVEASYFVNMINTAVDAYAQITDQMKYQHSKWETDTRRLCQLRNDIQKLITEKKNEPK